MGFTLIELLVVLIIVGILAGLAIPNFTRTRERALDKEAQIALRLIQAAERVYQVRSGSYCCTPTPFELADLNRELGLELSSSSWMYRIWSVSAGPPPGFQAFACRNDGSPPCTNGSREWGIDETGTFWCNDLSGGGVKCP